MAILHITHSSWFLPVLQKLNKAGAPVHRYLKEVSLDRYNFEQSDSYIPLSQFFDLLEIVHEKEGVASVISEFVGGYKLEELGDVGRGLASCPDLLTACRETQRTDAQFQTNQRFWLEVKGKQSKLHNAYLDLNHEQSRFMEVSALVIMMEGFRIAGGQSWLPSEIHTTLDSLEEFDKFLPINECDVKFNQSSLGLVFPTIDLSLQMGSGQGPDILSGIPDEASSLSERIEYLINSVNQGRIPNLELIADNTDITSRSIQRQLAAEGTTYFQIVDDWRFKNALRLLAKADLKISEIAEQLHYANPSNFLRFFKRRTGVSPNKYRESL
jgi:AraC-like DNA-binding protein